MVRPALEELEEAHKQAGSDPNFTEEYDNYLRSYLGRPSPFTLAGRLTEVWGGARIYLKREDLNPWSIHGHYLESLEFSPSYSTCYSIL